MNRPAKTKEVYRVPDLPAHHGHATFPLVVGETDVAVGDDVAQAAENPITADISAPATIHRRGLFDVRAASGARARPEPSAIGGPSVGRGTR